VFWTALPIDVKFIFVLEYNLKLIFKSATRGMCICFVMTGVLAINLYIQCIDLDMCFVLITDPVIGIWCYNDHSVLTLI